MGLFDDLASSAEPPGRAPIPPAGRALLDTIAGTESPGYDVLYGGRRFTDYADHPRQAIPITTGPNAGKVSTAAGRYQFLSGTWDDQAKKLGLTSFAPENQDTAAWNLAQEAYRARTRRDLAADLEAAKGNPGALRMIGGALSGTWTSLPGGIEANRTADSFGARYMKALGQQSAQAATPSNPGGARFEELNFPTLPPASTQNAPVTRGGLFADLAPAEPSPAGRGISDAGGVMRPEAPGVMEDVARSAGAGLVRGVAGSIPAQGGGSVAVRAAQLAAGAQPTGGVTSPEQAVEAVAGPLHRPQTVAGEYAQAVGEFAPGALMPGGVIRRAANVVVPAVASETAGQATKGTAAEVPARIAGAVSGALVAGRQPRVPEGMPAGLEANIAARNIGVDLPRAIGTDSQLTKFAGQVMARAPGGGPVQKAVAGAQEQLGGAISRGVEMTGGAADLRAAGDTFREGIQTSFKPTLKARVSEAYDAVDKFISPDFMRPLSATQEVAANIMARREASGATGPGKAVDLVLEAIQRPTGLTYAGVKDLRTRLGELVDTNVLPEGMSQGELRQLYGALTTDLKATVLEGGGKAAEAAFNKANATAKFAADWRENLRKALGPENSSGEAIAERILRMASGGSTGDLKALTMARGAVPKEVWQDVAATAVSRLGFDKKGQFSPAIFMNDYVKMSEQGKRILFHSIGSGDLIAHLNDIAAVSKKFIEAGKLVNSSGTAGHSAFYTSGRDAIGGIIAGSLLGPVTAIGTIVGSNMMARVLGKPASAASLARWSRAYEAVAKDPTPRNGAAFKIASTNLANTLSGELGARIQPTDVMRSIQAPASGRAEDNQ